jgi:5'-3' exonuclease
MKLLVDGDIVAFRAAASAENEESHIACWRAAATLRDLRQRYPEGELTIFLSGDPSTNFRYKIYPEYKSNRKAPRPKHLEDVREYLVLDHGATLTEGCEADDALGIAAKNLGYQDCVICSIDKDLLQIPGTHFNWVTGVEESVTEWSGLKSFYTHVLVGDSSDFIKGCKGIGKQKAPKYLEGCENPHDLFCAARDVYRTHGDGDNDFYLNARLIWVLREPPECKQLSFPLSVYAEELQLESTHPLLGENIPSMEHTIAPNLNVGSLSHGDLTGKLEKPIVL